VRVHMGESNHVGTGTRIFLGLRGRVCVGALMGVSVCEHLRCTVLAPVLPLFQIHLRLSGDIHSVGGDVPVDHESTRGDFVGLKM
jgi:hypothetical protein